MMRSIRRPAFWGASIALLVGASAAHAQPPTTTTTEPAPYRAMATAHPFISAPGNYGTSFGVPSYKMARLYSEFSSPYGAGYGYGYAPYGFIPGPYGAGLWRPGMPQDPLYNASTFSYRTWAVPYVRGVAVVTPGMGVYAPAFGPPYEVSGH
jgi:hypothetical protein